MEDLVPLADRGKRAPPEHGGRKPQGADAPTRFHFPEPDEPRLGVAAGMQASQLRQLRKGRIRPEVRIDLHGLRGAEAAQHVIAELSRAAEAGRRCVVVIHGKGLQSHGEPVLRAALPGWLADPRLGGRVLAFAPAQPDDGGSGATYVLLRRPKTS